MSAQVDEGGSASQEPNPSGDVPAEAPSARQVNEAFAKGPVILYSPKTALAVLWSAKAASTFAAKWFYFQAGLLDEAIAYSAWPHHYREQVFCASRGYNSNLRHVGQLGPRAVKFVRDPFSRAVSGYLSFCDQTLRLTHPPHGLVLDAMGEFLGRPIGNGESMSFREYVAFLGSIDLATADLHVRVQVHPAERHSLLPELTVIRIEQSKAVLPGIERNLGLLASDMDTLRKAVHHTKRVTSDEFVGDKPFGRTVGIPIPNASSFYDAELAAEVRRLYAEDCELYGYELSA